MEQVDDTRFQKFVDNELSQEEMQQVEQELIASKEADAALDVSIINYEMDKEEIHRMIGLEKKEEKIENMMGIEKDYASILSNKQLNRTNMSLNLTSAEVNRVKELCTAFNESVNTELSLDENLANFYKSQVAGSSSEESAQIVADIRSGITEFNKNLCAELEGKMVDYMAKIEEMSSELSREEQYCLYVNFLASLTVLSIQNYDEEHASQINDFATIKNTFTTNGEVTDAMLEDMKKKVADAINDNTLCLSSMEAMDNLINALPEGESAVEDVLLGSEADMQAKLVTAISTYVAYRNEEIESLKGKQLSAQTIAVASAAGIEQTKALEAIRNGSSTKEAVVKVLKAIGKAALWTTLTLFIAYIGVLVGAFSLGVLANLIGATSLGLVVCTAVAGIVGYKAFSIMKDARDLVILGISKVYHAITKFWTEKVWPKTKEKAEEFTEMVHSKQADGVITQTDEETPVYVTA